MISSDVMRVQRDRNRSAAELGAFCEASVDKDTSELSDPALCKRIAQRASTTGAQAAAGILELAVFGA